MPNCDLHSHSTVSDGLMSPAELVARAAANGVDVLALTDHDDLGGLAAARLAADAAGVRFVNGVEISIEWSGSAFHILGLGFDAENAALRAGLAEIRSGRVDRAKRMSAALERVGVEGAFDGAMRYAENSSLISRAHFARYLVEIGRAKDVRQVFDSYLVPGKPGYVDHRWATLEEAVGWIDGAGGIAVIAHPGRYKVSSGTLRRFIGEFRDCGGRGIEVTSGSHSPDEAGRFGRIAREFGLLASRGSDFHGPEESYVDLGRLPELPDGLDPVWSVV